MLEKANTTFEKTVIVGIITQKQDENKLQEYLDELDFLTFTAGGEVVKRFFQKMERPNPKTFLGTGKMEEINLFVKENGISTVIFDDELSPSQQKNITSYKVNNVLQQIHDNPQNEEETDLGDFNPPPKPESIGEITES